MNERSARSLSWSSRGCLVVLTLDSIWEVYSVKASGSTTRVHCFGAAHCSQHQAEVDDEFRVEDEEESELKSKVDDIVEEQQH